MIKCKYEGTGIWNGRCVGTKEVDPCPGYDKCKQYKPNYTTNADRFRAMSNEEQQSFVRGFWEIEDFADWLQQPADGDDHAYLKPCPFCGGEAKLLHPCDGVHLVQCTCCGCGTTYTRTEIGAVRIWNRRVGEVRHVG